MKANFLEWLGQLFNSDKVVVDENGIKSVTLDTLTDGIDAGTVLFDEPKPTEPTAVIEDNNITTESTYDFVQLDATLLALAKRLDKIESVLEIVDNVEDAQEFIEL